MLGTLRRVPFVIWLLLAQFFVFAGASQIAPLGEAEHLKEIIIFYILFQVALLAYWKKRPPWMRATLNQSIAWFTGAFVVTVFVLVGIGAARGWLGFGVPTYAIAAPLYLLVVHGLVVAASEELIFRGMLSQIITPVPGAAGFAIYHTWAYQGNPFSIFIAFIAGMFFYLLMVKTNIWAAVGVHFGWNSYCLGIWTG